MSVMFLFFVALRAGLTLVPRICVSPLLHRHQIMVLMPPDFRRRKSVASGRIIVGAQLTDWHREWGHRAYLSAQFSSKPF